MTSTGRPKGRIVRQSWAAYDALIEKAFAKHDTPTATPEPSAHPFEPETAPDHSLDPLWERVWELKSRALEMLPSKVKSLDVARREALRRGKDIKRVVVESSKKVKPLECTKVEAPLEEKQPKLKRKSSATFHTSADGRLIAATFDMLGVHKQDMHVSFRPNGIVVTWRRVKTEEKVEDGILVRERKEKQYCQILPLPEGICFEEIRASRDGQRLLVTYPNSRCIRVTPSIPTAPTEEHTGEVSTTVCSEEMEFQTCKLAPSTLEMFEVEKRS